MDNLVGGTIGLIHLIASIIALITGLLVLTTNKGTKRHKRTGYIYATMMILLNLTAFGIYRLYGKFGIFHWFAVISCLTLFAGLYPVLTRKRKDYLITHFNFMYWSVIGLYCAFMAETLTRLPKIILAETGKPLNIFYKMVGVSVALTMAVGMFFYIKFKPKWTKQFERK